MIRCIPCGWIAGGRWLTHLFTMASAVRPIRGIVVRCPECNQAVDHVFSVREIWELVDAAA